MPMTKDVLSSSELSVKAQHCLWPWVSWVETWIIHYSETRSWRAGSVTLGTSAPDPIAAIPTQYIQPGRKGAQLGLRKHPPGIEVPPRQQSASQVLL